MDRVLRIRTWTKGIGEALLPRGLFLPGLPRSSPTRIKIDALPLGEAARIAVRQSKEPIIAVLDPVLTLRRQISLPKAVGTKADSAIGLQLRQTLPGQGQGLIWRATAVSRTATATVYEVYLLKQSQLDDVLAGLHALGATVEAVVVEATGLDRVWERNPGSKQTSKLWLAFSSLLVALIGVLAVIGLERDRSNLADLVNASADRVAALEDRLVTLRAEADQSRAQTSSILSDLDQFAAQARRLRLLTDLTGVLPDTVWVSELAISNDRIVLSGFTSDPVTDVIGLIQGLPWAKEVELNGAISFDSYSGQNRFELGLRISDEATG